MLIINETGIYQKDFSSDKSKKKLSTGAKWALGLGGAAALGGLAYLGTTMINGKPHEVVATPTVPTSFTPETQAKYTAAQNYMAENQQQPGLIAKVMNGRYSY